LTSEEIPEADLPAANTTATAASTPTPGAPSSSTDLTPTPSDYQVIPEPSSESTALPQDSEGQIPAGNETGSATEENEVTTSISEPTAEPSPIPAALDASALTLGPQLGEQSLDPEINRAVIPALAASLRLTEGARKQLDDGQVDDAMRALARAVSLDPADAFAYYYLGRAYLVRKNYTQALMFFRRAEIGFSGRPNWAAEALSYEGLCNEELGKSSEALQAYKRALKTAPDNFRARIGYGRLVSIAGPNESLDAPPPNQDLAIPPPSAPDESAPPEPAPPAPPE
jgi:TolA-binding protein